MGLFVSLMVVILVFDMVALHLSERNAGEICMFERTLSTEWNIETGSRRPEILGLECTRYQEGLN